MYGVGGIFMGDLSGLRRVASYSRWQPHLQDPEPSSVDEDYSESCKRRDGRVCQEGRIRMRRIRFAEDQAEGVDAGMQQQRGHKLPRVPRCTR